MLFIKEIVWTVVFLDLVMHICLFFTVRYDVRRINLGHDFETSAL